MTEVAVDLTFADQYESALLAYLKAPAEIALLSGYEIGRAGLAEGVSLLELVSIHFSVVSASLKRTSTDEERQRLLDAHSAFLTEALSPFEMGRRAFRDANAVLRRMNDLLEGQAKRIAYALHSEAGQLLASVHMQLADAARDLSDDKCTSIVRIRETLLEIENRLRNLSHELRPPVLDDLGLSAALALMAQGVSNRWGLPVIISVDVDGDLPAVLENTVYGIATEALTNTAKHAGASRAEVRVRQVGKRIICSVRDDGTGFDDTDGFQKNRPGIGLTEIKERVYALGGITRLSRNGERGTNLTIELPL